MNMTDSPVIIKKRTQLSDTQSEISFSPKLEGIQRPIKDYYEKAWSNYQKLVFPTTKEEAWRRTDIRNIDFGSLKLAEQNELQKVPSELLEPLTDSQHGGEIIITPGQSSIFLSQDLQKKGVIFTEIKTALSQYPELVEKIIGKLIDTESEKLDALAAAFANNGIFLYVPQNVKIDLPLHSLFWASGEGNAYFTHFLVYLEKGSELTYVHESSSSKSDLKPSIHSGLMEIFVGEEAKLTFVELQSWGDNIWNFTHEKVSVERNGNIDWIFGALGSHLTKNFSDLDLVGEGSTGKMSGFYFTQGKQHLDHDTQQNHLAPHTTSDLLFKGALIGESQSVWQGMIYVSPKASKTDGFQTNRNLILDDRSQANSIPGLEILTDDVRCSHGATVGKIDQDQVFYLQSRGLSKDDAERLIVEGFFDPIMQRIPFEGVKNRFQKAIKEKMGNFHLDETVK